MGFDVLRSLQHTIRTSAAAISTSRDTFTVLQSFECESFKCIQYFWEQKLSNDTLGMAMSSVPGVSLYTRN